MHLRASILLKIPKRIFSRIQQQHQLHFMDVCNLNILYLLSNSLLLLLILIHFVTMVTYLINGIPTKNTNVMIEAFNNFRKNPENRKRSKVQSICSKCIWVLISELVLLNTEVLRPSWWWRIYPHPAPPCELVTSPLVSTLASYWSGEHHVDLLIGRFISHFCSQISALTYY